VAFRCHKARAQVEAASPTYPVPVFDKLFEKK